jgi:triacylglycerol lipase
MLSTSLRATVVAIALLGVTGAVSGPFAASAAVTPPSADPFYAPPSHLASHKPGTILRRRAVTVPGVNDYSAAYQLLYRTTDAKRKPIAAVTTLFVPSDPDPGPRRLFSLHTAYDSLTLTCAPSNALRTGQVTGLGDASVSGDTQSFLSFGWDVAVPDYEGLDSQWTVGRLEGRVALDGIRAAEHFDRAELEGARTQVAMGGYSGGSIPTLWGASLAKRYAPELNIVAAAAGGNVPDPYQDLAPLDGSPLFGTVVGVAVGVDRAYPELRLDSILNAKGRALAARDAADADGCAGSVTNAPLGTVAEYSNYPNPEALLALPRVRRVFARMNLIHRPAPAVPSFIFNSAQDELASTPPVDQLVAAWCAEGATIEYQTPPGDHATGSGLFGRQAVPFIEDRFAGIPPPDTCPR